MRDAVLRVSALVLLLAAASVHGVTLTPAQWVQSLLPVAEAAGVLRCPDRRVHRRLHRDVEELPSTP